MRAGNRSVGNARVFKDVSETPRLTIFSDAAKFTSLAGKPSVAVKALTLARIAIAQTGIRTLRHRVCEINRISFIGPGNALGACAYVSLLQKARQEEAGRAAETSHVANSPEHNQNRQSSYRRSRHRSHRDHCTCSGIGREPLVVMLKESRPRSSCVGMMSSTEDMISRR